MNQEPETDGYKWKCPKCENDNAMKLWTCGHCKGYKRPRHGGQHDAFDRNPKLCSFVSYTGRQCPLAGDISDQIGPDKPLWCSGHLEHRTGPEAEKVYAAAVANYDQTKGRRPETLLEWWEREGRVKEQERKKTEAAARQIATDEETRRREAEALVENLQAGQVVDAEYNEYATQEGRPE